MSEILTRFPPPPGAVRNALAQLQILRRGDADEIAAAGDLVDPPRPWDPATCPNELREAVWSWCDSVAEWLNHEYAWRPTQMIPPCWPHHAHIARELPILACLRWSAEESISPEPTEEWHRYTFPMFCERLFARLGESPCRTGKHIDWPAESRYASYTGEQATGERQRLIYIDTHPPTPLRPARRA